MRPELLLPTGYTRKPAQRVTINRRHPMAPACYWLPGNRGAGHPELVRGISQRIPFGTETVARTMPAGLVAAYSAGFTTPAVPNAQVGIQDRFTFSWHGYVNSSGGRVLWGRPYTSSHSSPYFDFVFFLSSSKVNARVTNAAGTSVETSLSTTSFATLDLAHIVATYDGTTVRLYINGLEEKTVGQTGNLRDSGEALYWGMNRAGTEAGDSYLLAAGLWNRALSAAEVYSLYRRPYQFLQSEQAPIARSGTVTRTATMSRTIGAVASTMTAKALAKLTMSRSLGAVASSATAKALAKISMTRTLGAVSSSITANHGGASVTMARTLGAVSSAATAKAIPRATMSRSLGAVGMAGTVKNVDEIAGTMQLGAVALSGAILAGGTREITMTATLGAVSLYARADDGETPAGGGTQARSFIAPYVDSYIVSHLR